MIRGYLRTFGGFEPDARLFLLTTLISGAAISLYWIDFNLYLTSLGFSTASIGIVFTAGSLAGVLVAIPASLAADRVGRRWALILGMSLLVVASVGLVLARGLVPLLLLGATFAAGQQTISVVQVPFLAERSRPEQRNELFAIQFAIGNFTNVGAALIGGFMAEAVARVAGFNPAGPQAYRVLLACMAALSFGALLTLFRLRDDRPDRAAGGAGFIATGPRVRGTTAGWPQERAVGSGGPSEPQGRAVGSGGPSEPQGRAVGSTGPTELPGRAPGATGPAETRGWHGRLRLPDVDRRAFFRLLLPGFIISVGAGQVIPFLNVFVERRFGLQLASLNALFAVTSLGTMVAILVQPALARRWGKIGSVVIVQGASIPFLVVLGFSPVFWTVAAAMAVRNALMNAGNPIFNAFAMEQVRAEQRATLSAAMSLLWSLGWVISGPWYSLLQAWLGFDRGYAVNFVTIIALYSLATALYWRWFYRAERHPVPARDGSDDVRAAV